MLFQASFEITFDEFVEAMRNSPLQAKGLLRSMFGWRLGVLALFLFVWWTLAKTYGTIDLTAIPAPGKQMSAGVAFYVLWTAICLLVMAIIPFCILRLKPIWQKRVLTIVALTCVSVMALLAILAGVMTTPGTDESPGFWTVQREYFFLSAMFFVSWFLQAAMQTSNRFRGLWEIHYSLHEMHTLRFTQDMLVSESNLRRLEMQYAALRLWYETTNLFVMFDGANLIILPKRTLANFTQIQNVRMMIAEKLSGRTFAFPVQMVDVAENQGDRKP